MGAENLKNIYKTRGFFGILKLFWVVLFGFVEQIYYKYLGQYDSSDEESIGNEVVVVTGADGGIGKALVKQLAYRNVKIVMGCLETSVGTKAMEQVREETGNNNLFVESLDLANPSSIQQFARSVTKKHPRIKRLFLVAGIGATDTPKAKTNTGVQLHVAINHLGHFQLTKLLLPSLKAASPARVIAMSSSMQLFENLNLNDFNMDKVKDFGFANSLPYSNTKYANALFMHELGKRLEGSGVTTYGVCPGIVRTPIWRTTPYSSRLSAKMIGLSPEQGCHTVLYCALSKKVANETGKMYRFLKHFHAANDRLDSKRSKELWELSERMMK